MQSHQSLVSRYSEIDDSVVESDILADQDDSLAILILGLLTLLLLLLIFLILDTSAGIFKLEGKDGGGLVDSPDLSNVQFNLLRGALDGLLGDGDAGMNLDNGLLGDAAGVLSHSLGYCLTNVQGSLDSGESFSEGQENELLTLRSGTVKSSTNNDFFAVHSLIEFVDHGEVLFIALGGVRL